MTQCQAKLYYTLHIFYYIKVITQFGNNTVDNLSICNVKGDNRQQAVPHYTKLEAKVCWESVFPSDSAIVFSKTGKYVVVFNKKPTKASTTIPLLTTFDVHVV